MIIRQKKTRYTETLKQIESLILDRWKEKHPVAKDRTREVNIFVWQGPASAGLRVSEVSMTERPADGRLSGTSGSSFMQCDTEAVPFLVERLAIEMKDPDPEFGVDDIDYYTQRLLTAIFE